MRFIPANFLLYFFLLSLGIIGFFVAIIWPQTEGLYAFIALAAAGGFGVALYIFYTKRFHRQLVCPVGSDCNVVITSRYSKFLHIPLEYCGMFYYGILLVSYSTLIVARHLMPEFIVSGLVILTTAAFFFSLYLLFVQAFLLRQWCIWCLLSAILSIGIFIISLAGIQSAVIFLSDIGSAIEALRAFGFTLGVGGSTIAIFLFFRFLHDLTVTKDESKALKGVLDLMLLGLVVILVSQFISYVTHADILARSNLFLIQTIALSVIAVGSAVLMIIFSPFVSLIPFDKSKRDGRSSPLHRLRRPLFVIGAISFSSWYFAFFTNYMRENNFTILVSIYGVVLAVAVVLALLWEARIKSIEV